MSYNAKKIISEDLGFYLTLKKFWQNLGIDYKDLRNLPYIMVETLSNIMMIEEQYQDREIKKTYDHNIEHNKKSFHKK